MKKIQLTSSSKCTKIDKEAPPWVVEKNASCKSTTYFPQKFIIFDCLV